jgi:hypothetical protein
MNAALSLLVARAVPLACVIGAVVMACHDKGGWGWLLFVAFLLYSDFTCSEK